MSAPAPLDQVMLIDDEEIDQMMFRRVIARSGLVDQVLSFRYAEDALAFLRVPQNPPVDAIFLDINMPRMSGFDFLDQAVAELGEGFARAVVVMLTTSLDPQDVARAQSFEVVKLYLNKPLKVEDVQRVVEAVTPRSGGA